MCVWVLWFALSASQPAHSSQGFWRDGIQRWSESAAICRGRVVDQNALRHENSHAIHTRTVFEVLESFQGRFDTTVAVIHRGGILEGMGEANAWAPVFQPGQEYLLFLQRRPDGTLFCPNGRYDAVLLSPPAPNRPPAASAARTRQLLAQIRSLAAANQTQQEDFTDQSDPLPMAATSTGASESNPDAALTEPSTEPTGLLTDGQGIPARFVQPDQGKTVLYRVDIDTLPGSITSSQAMEALASALAAWESATDLQFEYMETVSFGQPSPEVGGTQGILNVQLHDDYHFISSSGTLGIGGRGFVSTLVPPAQWGTGGNVDGREFHRTTYAYVVLNHRAPAMENLDTFEEVLCHEIGHALGLDHSSENPAESDPVLSEAMMYFQAHEDGRGAQLGTWDPPILRQVHPADDTPPYSFPRIMDVTTDIPDPPTTIGINKIQLRGYDRLPATPLTILLTNASANAGTFQLQDDTLLYTPDGLIQADRLDPAEEMFYDRAYVRYSDGRHQSPPYAVRVISLNPDNRPTPAGDGIPDAWMIQYFGDADPDSGPNRAANDDADGDGLTNLEEYQIRTDPTDPDSNLRLARDSKDSLHWIANPYLLYELQESSDSQTWQTVLPPYLPTTNEVRSPALMQPRPGQPVKLFRLYKVP